MQWVTQYLEEYYAAMDQVTSPTSSTSIGMSWSRPPTPLYKVNINKAIFLDHKAVSISIIIRDDRG